MSDCTHGLLFRQCSICLGLSDRFEMEESFYHSSDRFDRFQEENVVSIVDAIVQEELDVLLDATAYKEAM